MKVVRKADIFTNFDGYLYGDSSIGECIDKCETLDLSDLIIELENIDSIESLKTVIEELKAWAWKGGKIDNL